MNGRWYRGFLNGLLVTALTAGVLVSKGVSAQDKGGEPEATVDESAEVEKKDEVDSRVVMTFDKGFNVGTADGRFKLKLGGWAHFMWTGKFKSGPYTSWKDIFWTGSDGLLKSAFYKADDTADETNEFKLRRARLVVKATMFRDLHAFVLVELVKEMPFLDYHLTYQPLPEIGIRVGQFKTPLSRQFLMIPWRRSFVSTAGAAAQFNLDRDLGIMLLGSVANKKFEYQVGVFNGSEKANKQDNTQFEVVARVATHPLGPVPAFEGDFKNVSKPLLSIGFSGAYNPMKKSFYLKRGETLTDSKGDTFTLFDKKSIDAQRMTLAADMTFMYRGFFFTGEFFYERLWADKDFRADLIKSDPNQDGQINALGWYFQAGYFVWKKKIELIARASMVRPNMEISDDDKWEATGGINFYPFGYTMQIQTEYSYLLDKVPGGTNLTAHQVRVQMSFKY